jgi:spermidine synthase
MTDKRIHFVFTDGKAYINRGKEKYDIIEADAHNPEQAFSGNLYSYDYFMMAKAHLKPGGYAVTWAPTLRVLKSFVKAYPHVAQFGNVLVGSESFIEYDREAIVRRIKNPVIKAYYQQAGLDVEALAAGSILKEPVRYGPGLDRTAITDINTDLFPKDEFLVPIIKN